MGIKGQFRNILLCIISVSLFCSGCSVQYNELDTYLESDELETEANKITEKEFKVLDVRETYGIDAEDNTDKCYVSLVLEDENKKREYYCYGPMKDDTYINIAGFVRGDIVKYLGHDEFEKI